MRQETVAAVRHGSSLLFFHVGLLHGAFLDQGPPYESQRSTAGHTAADGVPAESASPLAYLARCRGSCVYTGPMSILVGTFRTRSAARSAALCRAQHGHEATCRRQHCCQTYMLVSLWSQVHGSGQCPCVPNVGTATVCQAEDFTFMQECCRRTWYDW